MSWDRVGVYNVAADVLGERHVQSLDDETELRRKFDNVWTRGDGAIAFLMEQGFWNFAMRSVRIDSDSAVTPAFGYRFAFTKPSDFRKLNMMCSDELFNNGLNQYEDEGDYWYANIDPIYVRFVSDHADWGGDYAKWTETFAMYAGAWLAAQVAPGMTGDVDVSAIEKTLRQRRTEARSNDALNEPTRFPQMSSWVTARHNSRIGRRDRGNRSSLLG